MALTWFRRAAANNGTATSECPLAVATARPSLWHRMGMARLFVRTKTAAVGTATPTAAGTGEVTPENLAAQVSVSAEPEFAHPVARSAWRRFADRLSTAASAMDSRFIAIAVPFGVHVRDPRRRYAVLLSVFTCLFVVGALPVPYLPLLALAIGYVGVLAISRAWAANENQRIAIVKKLKDGDPDEMPDLSGAALVSALQLLLLFPLAFLQLHRHFALFEASSSANFLDWVWFSLDKTYLKALPDWSVLYGVHISSIDFDNSWGRHLVLLSRLTFDYILLQGVYRMLALRATIREAVAVVKTDPDVAVRVGRRAIPALVDRLSDPDRAVRGAAANAITQLGDPEGTRLMREALDEASSRTG